MKAKRTVRTTNRYEYWPCWKLEREWYRIVRMMRRKDCEMPVLGDK